MNVATLIPGSLRDRFSEILSSNPWLPAVAALVSGVVVGLILEKVVLAQLRRIAARTSWKGDDVVVGALHRIPFFWSVLAGVYWAIQSAPMHPRLEELLRNTLLVIFILTATWTAARIASGLIALYSMTAEGALPSTSILRNLVSVFVFSVGILVVLQTLGISITPILTALGVGGLAVALALKDTLSNLFSGLQIIASRQVRVGDYIKLSTGEEGYVADIQWRNTTVRALSNNIIVVPNAILAQTITTNYYQPEREISVLVELGVAYDSDLQKVERVTIGVARQIQKSTQGAIATHEPFIRFHTFADSSIKFSVILRGHEFTDQYLIKHEFVKALQERYRVEGIEIPFPIRTLYVKNEDKTSAAGA